VAISRPTLPVTPRTSAVFVVAFIAVAFIVVPSLT
jgi:hypothetical protein